MRVHRWAVRRGHQKLVASVNAPESWRRMQRWAPNADRYEAELEGYEAVRELAPSPWEAVHRLVSTHRGLLERRWSA
jgi:hypothetical protein